MKNQYFADKRDFFKYDFLMALMECQAGFRRLVYAPMLTRDDGTGDGRLIEYQSGEHPRRQDLWNFLRGCLEQGRRDVRELRRFMKDKNFEFIPYMDDACFEHSERGSYFDRISRTMPRKAVVFFDPDNGFEVPSTTAHNGDKYIRYSEVAQVMERMDVSSAAVVYQHLPRKDRDHYFSETGRLIRELVKIPNVFAVTDNAIAFFVIPKSTSLVNVLLPAIIAYAAEHQLATKKCR